ncbi:hypothetical protein JP75_05720 [Devosia riboflavina]|uniref:Uncharacterized protein n=1 Tax=Devosia riboflavina TaxID=46914 RepID=A0A087M4U8_9HYPH|nr:hypothetical protein JP75_05720 [Devosia riboflavina]
MTGPKPNRKWGRGKGGGYAICHEPWVREEEDPQLGVAIRGPREEEFGARLSDTTYMNSTKLVGNPGTDMSAMHFCKGAEKITNAAAPGRFGGQGLPEALEKKKASPEGRAKP